MFRVSKFLPSTCKVVQKWETRVRTLAYTNYNAGRKVAVQTLQAGDRLGFKHNAGQSIFPNPPDIPFTMHSGFLTWFQTLKKKLSIRTVSCVGAASLGPNWYTSSWITGTVLTSITFVYPLINTIIQLSVCINEGQLMSLRERQRIVYWHIFNVYDLNTVSFMLLWSDWQMVKMVLSNILYFYRLKQINWT